MPLGWSGTMTTMALGDQAAPAVVGRLEEGLGATAVPDLSDLDQSEFAQRLLKEASGNLPSGEVMIPRVLISHGVVALAPVR